MQIALVRAKPYPDELSHQLPSLCHDALLDIAQRLGVEVESYCKQLEKDPRELLELL